MKIAIQIVILAFAGVVPAAAQTTGTPRAAEAPSMTSSATTMAPVAPGSSKMHEVPTPSVEKRSTAVGTENKLSGKGGN